MTDGTDVGTHRLAGQPAADTCSTSLLQAHGTKVYFTCSTPDGIRLWRTDGTKAGTKPITSTGELRSVPDQAVLMGKRLYFTSSSWDDLNQEEDALLWRTDGTAAGTLAIMNVPSSPVANLVTSGGRLYFRLGSSLWMSNGAMGSAVNLGMPGGGSPAALTDVFGTLCFIEVATGTWSLWESDGSLATTHLVNSFVNPPGEFQRAAVNGRLFFAADDGVHGTELWSYTP